MKPKKMIITQMIRIPRPSTLTNPPLPFLPPPILPTLACKPASLIIAQISSGLFSFTATRYIHPPWGESKEGMEGRSLSKTSLPPSPPAQLASMPRDPTSEDGVGT